MEGNTLMDDIKQVVLQKLRMGYSITELIHLCQQMEQELLTLKEYVEAIKDSDFAP